MPVGIDTCICYRCGKTKPHKDYYQSYSKMYGAYKHLPVCKQCCDEIYLDYFDQYDDSIKAMKRLCMALDLYFDGDLFAKCDPVDVKVVGKYFRKLNMIQYQGKDFGTSIDEGIEFNERAPDKKKKKDDEDEQKQTIDPRFIKKWGTGFEAADYDILQEHYKYLTDANPNRDSNQEIFINDLCYTQMQKMKALRDGRVDDYNKLTESYRKSFTQAGLKTVRDNSINEDFILGVTIEDMEKYTPAEYYKDKEKYKDHDGIGEYIERFMLRPLRNLQFGTHDRDEEYHVKDEDESGDIDADDEE